MGTNTIDNVNHPNHYKSNSGLETIDVIRAFTEGLNGMEAVDTANVLKYICRWKKKNGVEDLRKAMWYLNDLIEFEEQLKKNNVEDHPGKIFRNLDDLKNYYDIILKRDEQRPGSKL